jgi:hypothetical protein
MASPLTAKVPVVQFGQPARVKPQEQITSQVVSPANFG